MLVARGSRTEGGPRSEVRAARDKRRLDLRWAIAWIVRAPARERAFKRVLVERVSAHPGEHVLDLECGPGFRPGRCAAPAAT
jgi:hypothetical protein